MARDIRVIQRDTSTGILTLAAGSVPTFVSGFDLLIQIVALAYYTDPGQDVFFPTEGAGVRTLIGQIDGTNQQELTADFLTRTAKIESEILTNQAGLNRDLTELLQSLTVVGIDFDLADLAMNPSVKIVNQANQSRVVTL